jgi:hypothetical protein
MRPSRSTGRLLVAITGEHGSGGLRTMSSGLLREFLEPTLIHLIL